MALFSTLNYFTLSFLISGMTAIGSGLAVFLMNRKNRTNQVWLLLSTFIAVWCLSYLAMIISTSRDQAWVYNWISHYAAIAIPIFYFIFVMLLTETSERYLPYLISFVAISVPFLLYNQTPLMVSDIQPRFIFNFVPVAGPLYTHYLAYYGLVVIFSLQIIWQAAWHSNGSERLRFILLLIFSLLAFAGGGSVFFFTNGINIPPYPIILFALHPIVAGYIIVKTRSFNAKVLIAGSLILLLWTFMFFRILLTRDMNEQILNVILLATSVFVGIFLIRSIAQEVKNKEENMRLVKDLSYTSDHLFVANEKLKELDHKKTEFVSIASHQLRTPLTAIKGYSSMLLEGAYGQLPPESAEAVRRIFESSQRLDNIIEDFLNLTRIELGKMPLIKSDFDIADLARQVVLEMDPLIKSHHLAISVKQMPGHHFVNADYGKAAQIIGNLLDNSIKYTPALGSDGRHGEIVIEVEPSTTGNEIRLSVSDNGTGIDKDMLSKVFDRFVQVKERGIDYQGTGQGLFVAKQLAIIQGGDLLADSAGEGRGASFTLVLPASHAS